ncbi:MAG: DUF721 domain-containing protein [Methylococcales bacterium]|jgi:hypothetical protein|nr:DUF721 domain-containing protein [Methylococcales bacterium]MBT7408578.1 DUF721 domain-containing protein [Methylococcales bacterium]
MKKPKSLNSIIQNNNKSLHSTIEVAKIQLRLLNTIKSFLPKSIQQHCLGAVPQNNNSMTLYTKNSAWCNKIRYYTPMLIESLNKTNYKEIKSIRIKVISYNPKQRDKPKPDKLLMTDDVSTLLKNAAENIDDEQLRSALTKLSNNHKPDK